MKFKTNNTKKYQMDILNKIQEEIRQLRSDAVAESSQRFFKHVIVCHGLKSKDSEKIANDNFALIKHLTKKEIIA